MSSTKIQSALEENKDWTIVEAAREFGDREYLNSDSPEEVAKGSDRVEIDIRSMGLDPSEDEKIRPIVRSAEKIQKLVKRYRKVLKIYS